MRASVVDVVDEDAADRVREEVREQQRAVVDDPAPCLADAPRRGEAPRRQAVEGVGEGVVRYRHELRLHWWTRSAAGLARFWRRRLHVRVP